MVFRRRHRRGRLSRLATALHWSLRLLLVAALADAFYLTLIWPDWRSLAAGPVPKSAFIERYERARGRDPGLPPLRWRTAPLAAMPPVLVRAVVLAEDARFYQHDGFDLIAFKEAMSYNLEEGRLAFGASTISQQTVKNLFLSPARNPLRKWHELVLTWGMERHLSKRRILEIYLNVAELGPGIYGMRTAARVYYGIPLGALDAVQAAELAASLPAPRHHNPATRTAYFERRAQKILELLRRYPGDAAPHLAPAGASGNRDA